MGGDDITSSAQLDAEFTVDVAEACRERMRLLPIVIPVSCTYRKMVGEKNFGAEHRACSGGAPSREVGQGVAFEREEVRLVTDSAGERRRREAGPGGGQVVSNQPDGEPFDRKDGGAEVEGEGVEERAVTGAAL